jgi:hypothetical protein
MATRITITQIYASLDERGKKKSKVVKSKSSKSQKSGLKTFKEDRKTRRCQARTNDGMQCSHAVADGRVKYCDKHG